MTKTTQDIQQELAELASTGDSLERRRESLEQHKRRLELELLAARIRDIHEALAPASDLIKHQRYKLDELWLPKLYDARVPSRVSVTLRESWGRDFSAQIRAVSYLLDVLWPVLERFPNVGSVPNSTLPNGFDLQSGYYYNISGDRGGNRSLEYESVFLAVEDWQFTGPYDVASRIEKGPLGLWFPVDPNNFSRQVTLYGGNCMWHAPPRQASGFHGIRWQISCRVAVLNGVSNSHFDLDPSSYYGNAPFYFE